MKKSVIKINYYSYCLKSDKWLISRLMTLFPWLDVIGNIKGLDGENYVSISVPVHIDSVFLSAVPKSCIAFRKRYVTKIDVYEEKVL